MAGIQLSGLASGLDWKSLVDQLMAIEHAPIDRLTAEQTSNSQASAALSSLGTRLTTLQTAVDALKTDGLFSGRTTALSGSGWTASAAAASPVGAYDITVSKLATASRRDGATDIGGSLAASGDVSGITLATMSTGTAVTGGTFTVNGQKITVDTASSLQDVFDAISTATGGDVTASYDSATDKVTLSSAAEITLGAANDTSNFLSVLKLQNSGTGTITSNGALGAVRQSGSLASAGLRTAVTAVDGDGAGSFTINGVTVNYNVNSDSLSGILKRINQSGAGVTATYDSVNDRVLLTNQATGDLGIAVSEDAGGLLGALGLTTGGTFVRGDNTEFSVNGGPTISQAGRTLDASAHGIAGLTLTVGSTGTQTVTVGADTSTMKSKINAFISAYNSVQGYITDATKITSGDGSVSTSVLSSNREVQNWARDLRSLAFAAVGDTGLRLESMGIDFTSGTNQLSLKDETKLDTILATRPGDVEAFFQTASTGFAAKFTTKLTNVTASNDDQQSRYTKANSDLDTQIADINRRLDQERAQMEAAFIRMEDAQSTIKQQQTTLTNAFGSSSSSSN